MTGTVTLPGTAMAPVALIATEVAEGAGLFNDTVQVEVALLARDEGLHSRLVNCRGALEVGREDG